MDNRTSSSFQAIKTISNSVKYPTICPQTSNLRPNSSSSPFHANNQNQTKNSPISHGVVIVANDVRSSSANQTNPEIGHQSQSAVLWLDDDDEPGFLTVATLIVGQSNLLTNMTSPPQQQLNNEFDSDLPVDDEIPPSYEQVVNESAL